MRVPLSWLGEYAELPDGVTGEQAAADLVRVGLEEEGVYGGDIRGPVVVGRVLDYVDEPQRNGKTVRWCHVDVGPHDVQGQGSRGIVCGADNFVEGDLVVVSLPGAVLAGGVEISARRTYGHVSDGMICSARELGLGDEHHGIIRLAEWGVDAPVGTDAIELLGLDEEIIEVNVTPDRGYAFSVRGVAREYALSTGARFSDPALVDVPAPDVDGFGVRLEDDAPVRGALGCDRYVARVVHGVRAAGPSPRWMQRRLEQAGMRPISLAVDVTNYVMLAVGQPLHAFDLAELAGPIVVRRARAGEHLVTLDAVERRLDPEDLLITDSAGGSDGGRVLALAGVMGGADSEVSAATTDVLLEAAHFDAVTVARTARRHKLSTEASRRFERGVDTDVAAAAAELAVRLLVEHGGGQMGRITDVDLRTSRPPVRMSADLPDRLVGHAYGRVRVVELLEAVGCSVDDGVDPDAGAGSHPGTAGADVLLVRPPSWRPDLRLGVDLVEEVARLAGYDQIPSVLPVAPAGRGLTHPQRGRRSIARALAEHGLVEVLTYPFVGADVADVYGLPPDDPRRPALGLANPLSEEQPYLRTWILPTLVEAARRNLGRGRTDLGLFEIGSVTRPERPDAVAARPPVDRRPTPEDLAAIESALPRQPRRVGVLLAGCREQPGWYGPGRPADWTDAVDAALLVGRTLGLTLTVVQDVHAPWHPGRCAKLEFAGIVVGHAGELHPKVVERLGLPPRTCAAELELDLLLEASGGIGAAEPVSTFPLAKEDVALVVDAGVPAAAVEAALREGAGDLLESVRLFDVYAGPQIGEGRKSLAFALRLRAPDRTLTAAEASAARDAAVRAAVTLVGAVQRGA